MEEAAEIQLRLFLKIVAQVERLEDLEALPDIDFNIRPGDTTSVTPNWRKFASL